MLLEMKRYSFPIIEGNQESIKLANNKHASQRTRHIDTYESKALIYRSFMVVAFIASTSLMK